MKQFLSLCLLISAVSLAGCGSDKTVARPEWSACYLGYGVEGSMLIYDYNAETWYSSLPRRDTLGFLPASTFKIFNSLVAIETGVVESDSTIIPWDSIPREISSHNRDHNLRSAIEYSVVWYYQEVARRIGEARMQKYIDEVGYGNGDISGGIDHFWLDGGLRITPRQQIEFLVRLYEGSLPFSSRSMDIVKSILTRDSTDNYILRYKTGWAATVQPQVGWLVGWVESAAGIYFFASNVVGSDGEAVRQARTDVAMKILNEENYIPSKD